MRFEGTLTSWNDERGFGRIESSQGGEPIFVHVSAWPRGGGRPTVGQSVTFEVELGPKGKRARNVQLVRTQRAPVRRQREGSAQWGTASLFAIPAFLVLYTVLSLVWKLQPWVAGAYCLASVVTFLVYAMDKSAAVNGGRRTPEGTLHALALAGGWPGALVAQQLLRHKSSKAEFRQVFWVTVLLNTGGLVLFVSPFGYKLLGAV
jgi:uncharacterized membrane protein YsdA (DUF1294 family)/cold shock CspA family protein